MTDPFRIFPRATAEERSNLKLSIEAVGVQSPVVVDEAGHVIDGHERRDVCIELGIDWLEGADVRVGLSEIERKALAIELNLWRRPIQLTQRQRNVLLDVYLIAKPQLSEHQVAELFGVNQSTVNRRKRALMLSHKLELVTATIGKDGVSRKIGNRRKSGRVIVKNKREYDSLKPAFEEVGDKINGFLRKPKRILALARRSQALEEVNSADLPALPSDCRIECCDFRNLEVPEGSVDVILTDVVWSVKAEQDWIALAELSKRWLKDDGLFCSIIGPSTLPALYQALGQHLKCQWTMSLVFGSGYRSWSSQIIEGWRPCVIFSKSAKCCRIKGLVDTVVGSEKREKKYHDWQQSLELSKSLAERLTRPGDVVLDPHLGTGTNAVACSLLGGRTFIGCDIDEQQVRTARYRVAHEGQRNTA